MKTKLSLCAINITQYFNRLTTVSGKATELNNEFSQFTYDSSPGNAALMTTQRHSSNLGDRVHIVSNSPDSALGGIGSGTSFNATPENDNITRNYQNYPESNLRKNIGVRPVILSNSHSNYSSSSGYGKEKLTLNWEKKPTRYSY